MGKFSIGKHTEIFEVMTATRLFEQTEALTQIEEEIDSILESEQEPEAKEQALEALYQKWLGMDADWEKLVQLIALRCKKLEAEANSIGEYIKDFSKDLESRKKRLERHREHWRNYLLSEMTKRKRDKVQGVFATVSLSERTQVKLIVPPEQLPSIYLKPVEVKMKQLTEDFKLAFARGEIFDFCEYGPATQCLTIRVK